jgi:hypothetical protein
MPDVRKRPCCICRRWFSPDPRIGTRQRACRKPDCQTGRRRKKQKAWRERNPDYFIARRIQDRSQQDRAPEPLCLPPPLSGLPWDIAQSQFGVQGADFIGALGTLLLRTAQSQFEAYVVDATKLPDTLIPEAPQSQMRPMAESVRVGMKGNEAGVSPTRSPL